MVSGSNQTCNQASIHKYQCVGNAVPLVWGLLRLTAWSILVANFKNKTVVLRLVHLKSYFQQVEPTDFFLPSITQYKVISHMDAQSRIKELVSSACQFIMQKKRFTQNTTDHTHPDTDAYV